MDDGLRVKLEDRWRQVTAKIKYEDWQTKRNSDWRNVVLAKLPELGKSIAVDGGFFNYLHSRTVFDRRTIEAFKQEVGTYSQVSSLLHALNKQPFSTFIRFCEALIESGQVAIVADLLTPELDYSDSTSHQEQTSLNVSVRQRGTSEDSLLRDIIDVREVAEGTAEVGSAPSVGNIEDEQRHTADVEFDWQTAVRRNFVQLTQSIDPDNGLLNELISRRVLSRVTADVIKSTKSRRNRVVAILDHVTKHRPASDFLKLCDALTVTNQRHVVKQYLMKDVSAVSDESVVSAERPQLTVNESSVINDWQTVLIRRRTSIIDKLDASDDFVDKLEAFGVMNVNAAELCREDQDVIARAEYILDYMQRRSKNDVAYFCQALNETGQQHVSRQYLLTPADEQTTASS